LAGKVAGKDSVTLNGVSMATDQEKGNILDLSAIFEEKKPEGAVVLTEPKTDGNQTVVKLSPRRMETARARPSRGRTQRHTMKGFRWLKCLVCVA
jgi:plasmid replication initiation protein